MAHGSSALPDGPSSSDAAALLDDARRATLDRPTDRRPHALYLAGVGILLGLWAGIAWATADAAWSGLISFGVQIVYLVGLIVLVGHRERHTRTVPRGTRRTALWGTVGTGALFLLVNLPALDRGAGGIPAAGLLAVVVATPALLAAARVARASRRTR